VGRHRGQVLECLDRLLAPLRVAGAQGRREDALEKLCLAVGRAAEHAQVAPAHAVARELGDGPDDLALGDAEGVLCQQEIPVETVARAAELAPRFFLNAAPARPGAPDAELTVVNRLELEALGERRGLVCVTLGADGAVLLEDGEEVARVKPPPVKAVDGTAAGDAFTACLVVSLLEGRSREESLHRSSAAGALAASRFGAQTSLPTADEVDALL